MNAIAAALLDTAQAGVAVTDHTPRWIALAVDFHQRLLFFSTVQLKITFHLPSKIAWCNREIARTHRVIAEGSAKL